MAGIREVMDADIDKVASAMRPMDRLECAACGKNPRDALVEGRAVSDWTYTIEDDQGKPVAVFGLSPLEPESFIGVPWLLGTEDLRILRIPFLKQSRAFVRDRMLTEYPALMNMVCGWNDIHIRWLEFCGFNFGEQTEIGPFNTPFLPFYMVR